jgi:hypothetical protein
MRMEDLSVEITYKPPPLLVFAGQYLKSERNQLNTFIKILIT